MLRLDKPSLFDTVGYAPHPGQVAVHRSHARHRVLACGVRWGKTLCGSMEALAALMAPCEDSVGWVVGPTYQHSERIFERVVLTVRARLEHRLVEYCARERRLVLCNLAGGRSVVFAKTADNPVSLLGEGLDWLIVDEAARVQESIWTGHLSQRLVDRRGWSLLLSTPRGTDWFYGAYKRGQKNRDAEYESWAFPSWTNPHLDRSVIDAERDRLEEDGFAQEYGAEFIGSLDDPCDSCGYPDPDVPGSWVVRYPYEIAMCEECGHEVDDAGHTLWNRAPNGEPALQIIRLVPSSGPHREIVPPVPVDPDDPAMAVANGDDSAAQGDDGPGLQTAGEFFGNEANA